MFLKRFFKIYLQMYEYINNNNNNNNNDKI